MSIYLTHKPASNDGGLFLKLKDGDTVKVRIVTPPAVYQQSYTNEDGETTVSTRYAWGIYNRNESKAQVFSQGKMVFGQLADLVEEWGEPTEFDITIKRTGVQLETRYSVTPAPKSSDLLPEQRKEVEAIDLLAAVKGTWLSESGDKPTPSQSGYDKAKAKYNELKADTGDDSAKQEIDEDNELELVLPADEDDEDDHYDTEREPMPENFLED